VEGLEDAGTLMFLIKHCVATYSLVPQASANVTYWQIQPLRVSYAGFTYLKHSIHKNTQKIQI
jgi:hypothetical protein